MEATTRASPKGPDKRRRLVLAGGGHAHALVLKAWGRAPLRDVELLLISETEHTPYSGMLPGLIAGFYDRATMHIDLKRLAAHAGARLIVDRVNGLNAATRELRLASGARVVYDLLSLNVGSVPDLRSVPGAAQYAVPAKPVSVLLQAVDAMDEWVARRAESAPPRRVVVVGAGAGGVELTLALKARFGAAVDLALVEKSHTVLPGHNTAARRLITTELAQKGIALYLGKAVHAVHAARLTLQGGAELGYDDLFWTTQATAPAWLEGSGLALTESDFVRVARTLRSLSHPEVYAAGDVASIEGCEVPKSGVYAVRAARPLAKNLRRHLEGRELVEFRPQPRALALLATGDGVAIASRGAWGARGRWVWWLKDQIDRRFMRSFA